MLNDFEFLATLFSVNANAINSIFLYQTLSYNFSGFHKLSEGPISKSVKV